MKIAFIHYHLKTGGVTTVMRQQIEAIQNRCDVLVLSGENSTTPFPADTCIIPELGYSDRLHHTSDPQKTAQKVMDAIFSKWDQGCQLIHVHNPTLAKNIQFLKILTALQDRQIPMFLQIHDFAEDGRPAAYFPKEYISNCHYGVINSRDYHILLRSGLKKEGLHRIHNTINPIEQAEQHQSKNVRVLYPVRAIRRKNIGEAILLSIFMDADYQLSITLPPNSPKDIISYEHWKDFVTDTGTRIKFEEGLHHDFRELVGSARFLVTTSINEGFGFSFLEPWTAGKLLWGRKIPDICRDFESQGIRLDHLYDRLQIPIQWIGKDTFFEKWRSCILDVRSLYDCDLNLGDLQHCFHSFTRDDTVDLGFLSQGLQNQVIRRVLYDPKAKDRLKDLNPFLKQPGKVAGEKELIDHNKKLILKHYNRETYRDTLLSIYQIVSSTPVKHRIDKKKLLAEFFNPKDFSLLKWCDEFE
jgi:hypothetical protein